MNMCFSVQLKFCNVDTPVKETTAFHKSFGENHVCHNYVHELYKHMLPYALY